MSSLYWSSKISIAADLPDPIAVALYSINAPLGSVSNNLQIPSYTPPMIKAEPNGLTPPFWVYICNISHNFLDKLSTLIGSLYVILFIWASTLALSTKALASATRPEVAAPICSSILNIFSIDVASTKLEVVLLSTAKTIPSEHLIPIEVVPLLTASLAYSTWKSLPSGLNTVIALSYPAFCKGCIN